MRLGVGRSRIVEGPQAAGALSQLGAMGSHGRAWSREVHPQTQLGAGAAKSSLLSAPTSAYVPFFSFFFKILFI